MSDAFTDKRNVNQKRSNVGLARDFSLARYDRFANAFEASAAQVRDEAAIAQYDAQLTQAHQGMLNKQADRRADITQRRALTRKRVVSQ